MGEDRTDDQAAGESRRDRIISSAERLFDRKVSKVSTPGGEDRASYRLYLGDMKVIATLRPNFRRTHLEAFVLQRLAAHCDDAPKCLGVDGEILFQSDVGNRRLNLEIAKVEPAQQADLAAKAVAAIFRLHSAGRKAGLADALPHLGANEGWVVDFVNAIRGMAEEYGGLSLRFNRHAAYECISAAPKQFVKWDCRSGNAALDETGQLRWFDFEYAGVRHGAEDFAWLIGDEAWPLSPQTMLTIMQDAFDPDCGHLREDWFNYLSVYLTFHCNQRLKLINKEAAKRGWLSKDRIRRHDDVGAHPDFARHLCEVGAFFAAQSPITAPLVRNFEAASRSFGAEPIAKAV